jgi:hypothetical protein
MKFIAIFILPSTSLTVEEFKPISEITTITKVYSYIYLHLFSLAGHELLCWAIFAIHA